MAASTLNVESVTGLLENCLSKLGLEVYPLKVTWWQYFSFYRAAVTPWGLHTGAD